MCPNGFAKLTWLSQWADTGIMGRTGMKMCLHVHYVRPCNISNSSRQKTKMQNLANVLVHYSCGSRDEGVRDGSAGCTWWPCNSWNSSPNLNNFKIYNTHVALDQGHWPVPPCPPSSASSACQDLKICINLVLKIYIYILLVLFNNIWSELCWRIIGLPLHFTSTAPPHRPSPPPSPQLVPAASKSFAF